MLVSFITFKSFLGYHIKPFISQVSERKRRDFHIKKNFISRVSSTHTGKGKLDVLCEYCSDFQRTNVYYSWLLLCWCKFPPGGMIWPLPETRNVDKSGFLWDRVSELKSSRNFLLFLAGLLVMNLWWWAVSLLERKAILSRFFFFFKNCKRLFSFQHFLKQLLCGVHTRWG